MKSKVSAGTISDVTKFFKTISDALFRGIDKLMDWGLKLDDAEEIDGVISSNCLSPGGNPFKVILTPVLNKSDVYQVEVKTKNGSKSKKFNNVRVSDIDQVVAKAVEDLFDENIGDINSSKKLNVTLKRVTSSRGDSINLTSVMANYDAAQALDDLTAIVSEDDFADMVTSQPTSFEITDEGDSFDITQMENALEVDPLYTFTEIIKAAFCLFYNIQCVHWNAKGSNFHTLHSTLNDYYYIINNQLDTAAEWCVEQAGWVPHPASLIEHSDAWDSITPDGFTAESGYEIIRTSIQDYVAILELYYCNVDHDIQSVLDEWIRGWKSQSDYIITRILKQ